MTGGLAVACCSAFGLALLRQSLLRQSLLRQGLPRRFAPQAQMWYTPQQ